MSRGAKLESNPRAQAVVFDSNADERLRTIQTCLDAGIEIVGWAGTAVAALDLLGGLENAPDVIVLDLTFADLDVADLLQALSLLSPNMKLILCSNGGGWLIESARTLADELGLITLTATPKPADVRVIKNAMRRFKSSPTFIADYVTLEITSLELKNALQNHEFELNYQPKFELINMSSSGAEALIRWHHPRHGLLPAGLFLPQAQAYGVFARLTLETVNIALRDWITMFRQG